MTISATENEMWKGTLVKTRESSNPPSHYANACLPGELALHWQSRGWEEGGGEGVVGPLTVRQSMRCKLPRRKNELRRRRRHERSATRVVKDPTHSGRGVSSEASPPLPSKIPSDPTPSVLALHSLEVHIGAWQCCKSTDCQNLRINEIQGLKASNSFNSCPPLLKITGNRMKKEQVHSQHRL